MRDQPIRLKAYDDHRGAAYTRDGRVLRIVDCNQVPPRTEASSIYDELVCNDRIGEYYAHTVYELAKRFTLSIAEAKELERLIRQHVDPARKPA